MTSHDFIGYIILGADIAEYQLYPQLGPIHVPLGNFWSVGLLAVLLGIPLYSSKVFLTSDDSECHSMILNVKNDIDKYKYNILPV